MSTRRILSALLLAAFPAFGLAADAAGTPGASGQFATLREVAQKAVLNNPEVMARWHNFKAAVEEVGVARGGYLPRVDLTAAAGREYLKEPASNFNSRVTGAPVGGFIDGYYNHNGYLLSLNQMLFDGFATSNEVKRLGKAQLVRYYELLEASEAVALEAARAYLDVLRYRFLVDLAEDNYVQHRATFEQLLRRTQSGVGRRVDLEQAASRLALAEVNLTTETANLHDVTARYQRLVDNQPPNVIYAPALIGRALPPSSQAALEKLLHKNPTLLAAIENVEAAQYDAAIRRAAYMPRFDLRARTDQAENYQGVVGERTNNVAEVVMTYNLFNGGSDRARERQYVERRNMAVDMREKACRDTRQTLAIAYNDVTRLRDQVSLLNIQVGLVEKTRDAYREQFNVGQRTLLDLLDTENELLSARRAAINADIELSLAYLRTYAGMGTLLEFLELKNVEPEVPEPEQLASVEARQLCAAQPVAAARINREALNARALALLESNRAAFVPQAQAAPAIVPVPAPAATPAVAAGGTPTEVGQQLRMWAAVAARKDFAAYEAFYAPTFTPAGGVSRAEWATTQRQRFAQAGNVPADLQNLTVKVSGLDRATAEFTQDYNDDQRREATRKTLELVKVGNNWLINRESAVAANRK
jgi:adhesin transport system outer membrane protein